MSGMVERVANPALIYVVGFLTGGMVVNVMFAAAEGMWLYVGLGIIAALSCNAALVTTTRPPSQ